ELPEPLPQYRSKLAVSKRSSERARHWRGEPAGRLGCGRPRDKIRPWLRRRYRRYPVHRRARRRRVPPVLVYQELPRTPCLTPDNRERLMAKKGTLHLYKLSIGTLLTALAFSPGLRAGGYRCNCEPPIAVFHSPFFGYYRTCWRPWPGGQPECPRYVVA